MQSFFQKKIDILSRYRFHRILRDFTLTFKIPKRGLGVGVVFFFFFLSFFPFNAQASTLTKASNNLGLVGYWPFNEGTGTVAGDFSGYGRNGTLNTFSTPPTATSGWGNGKLGKALNFDGSSDYVTGPDLDFPSGNFTISVWFKNNPGTIGKIISKTTDWTNFNFELWVDSSTEVYGGLYDGVEGQYAAMTGVTVDDGKWHHAVFTVDSSNLNFYLDGVLGNVTDTFDGSIPTNDAPLEIGSETFFGAGAYQKGSIDEVRIYSRALSQSEVLNLYKNSGVATRNPVSNRSLVGWWPMEEGTSTMIADYSGNNNHGTTTGMAVPPTAFSGWTTGRLGKSLNFDSENDRVDIPDSGSLNFGGITTTTFAAWVYLDSYPPLGDNYIYQIIGDESACAAGGSVIWRIGSQGSITYQKRIGINFRSPTDHDDQNNTDLPLRTWTHIAVTTDGTNARYYINGRLDTTNAYAFTPQSSPCSWGIGYMNGGNARFFDGKIDDVRIYKRTLSPEEISALARLNQTAGAKAQTGVVPNGLVGYWSFGGEYMNWNNNRALDASPSRNDGTITNMSTSTSAIQGILGQALKFDGVDDYINVGDPANNSLDFEITNPFSISAWVNRPVKGSSVGVVYKRSAISSGYDFSITTADILQFNLGDNFGSAFRIGADTVGTVPNVNQWYHVVVTYSGNGASSGINMYIDGVKQSITNNFDNLGGGSSFTTEPLSIGARENGTGRQFNGRIDEVRVYNRSLSDSEVLQLYRANR